MVVRKVWRAQDVARNYNSALKMLALSMDTIRYWGTPDDLERLQVAYQHLAILQHRFQKRAVRQRELHDIDQKIGFDTKRKG